MPIFVLSCIDKPDSLALRMSVREAHLAYMRENMAMVKVAGPYLTDDGQMAGSMLVLDAPDRAAVEALSAADPYRKAGLFARVEITPWRVTVGQLG